MRPRDDVARARRRGRASTAPTTSARRDGRRRHGRGVEASSALVVPVGGCSPSCVVVFLVACLVWEAFKWLFGDPWRLTDILGTGVGYYHQPPFHLLQASDLAAAPPLEHRRAPRSSRSSATRDMTLARLPRRGRALHLARGGHRLRARARSSASCWRRSSSTSRLAERAFVPYVIASQTIPIVALAPLIVVGFGRGPRRRWSSSPRTSRSSR